jgi:GNAT superfamily N-acetyltransferase
MKKFKLSDRESSDSANGILKVVVLKKRPEIVRFDQMLAEEHFLGSRRPSGHTLRQVGLDEKGRWVGLLLWVSGFWHLKDRDQWIGWDSATCAERLKLIVHNARFLVPEAARSPNLPSQVLSAALRVLPHQWCEHFGYEPLLAETFTDPERHAGTVYKATGWIGVGESCGFPKDHRCDYYRDHKRPKQLWIKPLHCQARQRLCASQLTEASVGARNDQPKVRCALKASLRTSLWEALGKVPDPRRREGRRYPLAAVLTIVALGLLRGAVHLATIHRSGLKLDQRQRAQLRLPFKKGTRFRQAPGYFVYRNVLRELDLVSFARVLTQWLQSHAGQLPRTLAIDGKIIRDHLGLIVSLVDAEEGVPVAVMAAPKGKGHELKTAQKLLASAEVNLHNATVTTDSLHCQDQTAHTIVLEKGGDFLFQVRDNQRVLHRLAQNKLQNSTPLLSRPKAAMAVMKSAK